MRLEFAPAAKAELQLARDQYEAKQEGLGRDFVREMREIAKRDAARPFRFPLVPGTSSRRVLGERFPYMLVFAVHGGVVRILCVSHQHRDPAFYRRSS